MWHQINIFIFQFVLTFNASKLKRTKIKAKRNLQFYCQLRFLVVIPGPIFQIVLQ